MRELYEYLNLFIDKSSFEIKLFEKSFYQVDVEGRTLAFNKSVYTGKVDDTPIKYMNYYVKSIDINYNKLEFVITKEHCEAR